LVKPRESHCLAGLKAPFGAQSILRSSRHLYVFRKRSLTIMEMTMSITSIVHLYQAWRRHEAVRRELSQLTDRELADIGITRSDIERIASEEAHS
jgi:uncharacterized protein YjiS (DUF1127 family)